MLRLRLRAEQGVHMGLHLLNQEALIQMAARLNREFVVLIAHAFQVMGEFIGPLHSHIRDADDNDLFHAPLGNQPVGGRMHVP